MKDYIVNKWLSINEVEMWINKSFETECYHKIIGNKKASDFATKFYFEIVPLFLYAKKTQAIKVFFVDDCSNQNSFDGILKYANQTEEKFECTKAISQIDAVEQKETNKQSQAFGYACLKGCSMPKKDWEKSIFEDIENAIKNKQLKAEKVINKYNDFCLLITLDNSLSKYGSIGELKLLIDNRIKGINFRPFKKVIIYTKTGYLEAFFVTEFSN